MIKTPFHPVNKFLTCLALLLFFAFSGNCESGKNMIKDPSFEDPKGSHWRANNWWVGPNGEKNTVETFLDEDNPRSGKYSQCVYVKKHIKRDFQFTQTLLGLKPGDAIQISFWLRGPANSIPLEVNVRMANPPYKTYYSKPIMPTDKWTPHKINIIMPKFTTEDVCLMFNLHGENKIWLDDVSVIKLSEKSTAPPLNGNSLANASFEVGKDRWYATFRERWTKDYSNCPIAKENNILADLFPVNADDAPDGGKVLYFPVFDKCSVKITSAMFPLRYGHPVNISFHLKTSKVGARIRVGLEEGERPNEIVSGAEVFNPKDTKWNRYEFKAIPKPSPTGKYYIKLSTATPGAYWIDNFFVGENTKANERMADVGWEPVDKLHSGNIFHPGDKVEFNLMGKGLGSAEKLDLNGVILDVWGNEIKKVNTAINLDANKYGEQTVSLPSNQLGSFKLELYLPNSKKSPAVEVVYHVLPRLTPLKKTKDSFYGGHPLFSEYNLHIAEKAGYRWLRTHDCLNVTNWNAIEPKKGECTFYYDSIMRARGKGFKILGLFLGTPGKKGFPSDWKTWNEYVAKTAKAFYPHIKHWEIWNEPDLGRKRIPSGEIEKYYHKMCNETRTTIDKTGLDLCLINGVISGFRPFTKKFFELGTEKEADVFSFHLYGKVPDKNDKKNIDSWADHKNRKGAPLDVWHTEGTTFGGCGPTWLKTSGRGNITSMSRKGPKIMSMSDAAADLAQTLAYFKAIGVKKNFHYASKAQPSGRDISTNYLASLTDTNGIPISTIASHAASVFFLEGSEADGVEEIIVDGANVICAKFKKGEQKIMTIWSDKPIPLKKIPYKLSDYNIYDMMGNKLESIENVTLTNCPLYMLAK